MTAVTAAVEAAAAARGAAFRMYVVHVHAAQHQQWGRLATTAGGLSGAQAAFKQQRIRSVCSTLQSDGMWS